MTSDSQSHSGFDFDHAATMPTTRARDGDDARKNVPDAETRHQQCGTVVLAGGGTGGHVYPALAIADALVRAGVPRAHVHFVGSTRGLEARAVPEAGYTISLLAGRGITRSLSLDAIRSVMSLVKGVFQAARLLQKRRPDVVVSVGGYAAAPSAMLSIPLRIPLVLAEQNAVPGAVHRLVNRFARASAVSWPNTPLQHATVTGNPVRDEIRALRGMRMQRRVDARTQLGLPQERVVVGVLGGSLGAKRINDAVAQLGDIWKSRADVAVLHVVGARDWESRHWSELSAHDQLWYVPVKYQSDMAAFYAACDVVVCRAGATTCAELAVCGVPAVAVPLPNTPGDHQTANARTIAATGGAVLLPDDACTGLRLAETLEPIVGSANQRADMAAAMHELGKPDAADRVADLVLPFLLRASTAQS